MIPADYTIPKVRRLDDLLSTIKRARDKYVAVDTETTGFRWMADDRAFGTAVSWDDKSVFLKNEDWEKEHLGSFLRDLYLSDKTICMHNAEFDINMIRETYGVQEMPANLVDMLRISYVLDTGSSHELKDLGAKAYGPSIANNELILKEYKSKYKIKDYSHLPEEILDPYACMDAILTKCLVMDNDAKAQKEHAIWYKHEHDLIPVMMHISRNGVAVDPEYLDTMDKKLKKEMYRLQEEIFFAAGRMVNPKSPDEIKKYMYSQKIDMYEVEELDNGKQKIVGSSDDEMLENIIAQAKEHPKAAEIAELVQQHRKIAKQHDTYVVKMREVEVNGRVHANFNPTGTITGRLSGSGPNMQNIPTDSSIKRIFLVDEEFHEFDWSQLEYRLAGIDAGERKIVDAYLNGVDFHSLTAAGIFNVPVDAVTKEQRQVGKTTNFLVLYGGGGKTLARKAKIPVRDGFKYVDNYWKTYPELKEFFDDMENKARQDSYVETMFGRKVSLRNKFYKAPNYRIQGTGGDMIKIALLRIWNLIQGTDVKIMNTVHDSVFLDHMEPDMVPEIQRAMESFEFYSGKLKTHMPIQVDVTTYDHSWGKGYDWTDKEKALGQRIRE